MPKVVDSFLVFFKCRRCMTGFAKNASTRPQPSYTEHHHCKGIGAHAWGWADCVGYDELPIIATAPRNE